MPLVGRNEPSSLGTLRSLSQTLTRLTDIQRQLATGQRVGRASDNPSAVVALERLDAEVRSLSQSVESAQRGISLFQAAEGGLAQATDLVTRARELAVQAADGTLSSEERGALQGQLDGVLSSLSRVGNAVDFGGQNLLSGASDFNLQDVASEFQSVQIRQARLPEDGSGLAVSVEVTAAAAEAQAQGAIAATQTAAATFEVSGVNGSTSVTVAAGATRAEVAQAVNAVSDVTGVVADETTGVITSEDVGSAASVEIRNLEGTLEGVTEGTTNGTDVQATVNGVAASGNGNTVVVGSPDGLSGRITLREGTGTGSFTFEIAGGGINLPGAPGNLRVAFPAIGPSSLGSGAASGGLATLFSGGANSLLSNPDAAARILDAARGDLVSARGALGGIQQGSIEGSLRSLQNRLENVSEARSRLGDTDFAQATAELTRERILLQSQLATLRRTHQVNAQQVLTLLGG